MLTAAEAAAQLGVKLGTLYAYVSRGWLKSYRRKVGREALYRRADIEALRGVTMPERGRRARSLPDASSWVTVAQPAAVDGSPSGVIVAESAVSSIVEGRQLIYRGYPIEELVERATFEDVCLLLWNGERPTISEVTRLGREVATAGMPAAVAAALTAVGRDAAPLLRLAVMMPVFAAVERRHTPRTRLDDARLIIGVMPIALATAPCPKEERNSAKGQGSGIAARLLRGALGGFAEWERQALDQVLVACAEHELNASTFAARVVASTGADLYASVLAALCSLSGPIHGGACDRIERMFAELESGTRLESMSRGVQRQASAAAGLRTRDLSGRRSARGAAQESPRRRSRRHRGQRLVSRPRSSSRKRYGDASGCARISISISPFARGCWGLRGDCRRRSSPWAERQDGSRTASSNMPTTG